MTEELDGGGSGSLRNRSGFNLSGTYGVLYSGSGSKGTSYSGGSGGGAISLNGSMQAKYAGNASGTGGTGGAGHGDGGAGAGNPSNGTGGLLVIRCSTLENNKIIEAEGSLAVSATATGGSSGGGSVNIFYDELIQGENSKISANGGIGRSSTATGGKGGNGCVTKGKIIDGDFIKE